MVDGATRHSQCADHPHVCVAALLLAAAAAALVCPSLLQGA